MQAQKLNYHTLYAHDFLSPSLLKVIILEIINLLLLTSKKKQTKIFRRK